MNEQERLQEEMRRQEATRQAQTSAETQRAEETRRMEEQRREEERRREESQRQENQRRESDQRQEKEPKTLHESTVQTMQGTRRDSEQQTIDYARKHGVPIAPASLSMSGRSQGETRTQAQAHEGTQEPDKPAQKPQAAEHGKSQPKESKAMEQLKAKVEAMKDKVQEHIQSKGKGQTQETGHDR